MPFYKITSYLTFPGIVLHETAHFIMCLLFGVKVTRVRFFRFDGSGGDVTYQSPDSYIKIFFIAMSPMVIGSICSYLLLHHTFVSFNLDTYLYYVCIWVGFCFALHSLPSIQDANSLLEYSKNLGGFFGMIFFIISLPVFIVFWILNNLRGLGLEIFWALFILYISYNTDSFTLLFNSIFWSLF